MLPIQCQRDLGVRLAYELVAFFLESSPNLLVSIQFAINHRVNVTFGIVEWLLPLRIQINNCKAVVAKSWSDNSVTWCRPMREIISTYLRGNLH